MPTQLTATDLVVRYNTHLVLDRATLSIQDHDRIGLVGRNGCGKTTFLRILAGLQTPDSGSVITRQNLVLSYLPQDFMLDPEKTVEESVREGARPVLDLITEFESLPADSPRHVELEERILALDGWTLDRRIRTALSHLNCPDEHRAINTLSGGERRRVALARVLVSRPELLILDEPTNHLDPESIEWVADFLEHFPGAFLVVTHDRYFLDRVVRRIVELADGTFYSHEGDYSDYLLDRAERQAAEAVVEHKRQMFLRRELDWVRTGPRAQRKKTKIRFDRFDEVSDQEAPPIEEDMELCIPPPPQLGNRVLEAVNLRMDLGRRTLFRDFSFSFENGHRIGVTGRNGLGKTTLLKVLIGQLPPTDGTLKAGPLTQFNYVDQGRMQLNEENTLLDEIADGTEFVRWGDARLSLRAYLKRFLFADERVGLRVRQLSGGERSRLLLAKILKHGGNFLILDEPTNDLDLPTLRVLEEALIAFPGVVVVVSHDRYFLNRVCTDILAFEGDERIHHSVGDYDYYVEKKRRANSNAAALEREAQRAKPPTSTSSPSPNPTKPRKLTWKEMKELEGIEPRILATETEIERIESLFASPDFHRTHAPQTNELKEALAAARAQCARLYSRWQELEAIKAGLDDAS